MNVVQLDVLDCQGIGFQPSTHTKRARQFHPLTVNLVVLKAVQFLLKGRPTVVIRAFSTAVGAFAYLQKESRAKHAASAGSESASFLFAEREERE